MNHLERLYRTAPARNSPESLDRNIIRQAEALAECQCMVTTQRSRLSSWMPIAASCIALVFGLSLLLRSGLIDRGSENTTVDGYPAAMRGADGIVQSRVGMTDGQDSIVERRQPVSNTRLLQQEPAAPSEKQVLEKTELLASRPRSVQQQKKADDSAAKQAAMTMQKQRSDLPSLQRQEKQRALPAVADDLTQPVQVTANEQGPASLSIDVESSEEEAQAATGGVGMEQIEISLVASDALEVDKLDSETSASDHAALAEHAFTESSRSASASVDGLAAINDEDSAANPTSVNDVSVRANGGVARSSALAQTNAKRDTIVLVGGASVEWLEKQSSYSYILQLATATDEIFLAELAQTVAEDFRSGLQFVVLQLPLAKFADTRFFALLVGTFASIDEAQNELTQLPGRTRKYGARVRKVGILQNSQ